MSGILNEVNVYGWDSIEDLFLSGYIAEYGVLVVGQTGAAKTLAAEAIGSALQRASKIKGKHFEHYYRNASTAQVEDLIGYPMPLSADEAAEKRKNGERPRMQIMLAQDSIFDATQLVIDEINRCPPITQNRWFSLVNEGRVDGVDLKNLRYIIGLMNPVNEYEGTEVLDRAFADRFNILVKPLTLHEMFENSMDEEATKIINTRLNSGKTNQYGNDSFDYGKAVSDESCLQVYNFIEEGRKSLNSVLHEYGEAVTEYVRNVSREINRKANGGANTQARISGRRASMMAQSICAVHATAAVKNSDAQLKDTALTALKSSFMHEVVGDKPFSASMLENVHSNYKGKLESKLERLLEKIFSISERTERIVYALNEDAGAEIVSRMIDEAYNYYAKKDKSFRMAFSYMMYAKLEELSSDKRKQISRQIVEQLSVDFKEVIDKAQDFKVDGLVSDPSIDSSKVATSLIDEINTLMSRPKGRAALAIGAAIYDMSDGPMGLDNNLDADSAKTKELDEVKSCIRSGVRLVDSFADRFDAIECN